MMSSIAGDDDGVIDDANCYGPTPMRTAGERPGRWGSAKGGDDVQIASPSSHTRDPAHGGGASPEALRTYMLPD